MKDFNFDNKNIYQIDSNQIQDNQNFNSDQKKSDLFKSDSENYFADHIDILALKIRVCQSCKQIFAFKNLLHKHLQKKNCSKKFFTKICQSDKDYQSNKDHLINQNLQSNQIHQFDNLVNLIKICIKICIKIHINFVDFISLIKICSSVKLINLIKFADLIDLETISLC